MNYRIVRTRHSNQAKDVVAARATAEEAEWLADKLNAHAVGYTFTISFLPPLA